MAQSLLSPFFPKGYRFNMTWQYDECSCYNTNLNLKARVLLDPKLIWFDYISHLSQRGGGG